jgi:FixJ family two-component response regulator
MVNGPIVAGERLEGHDNLPNEHGYQLFCQAFPEKEHFCLCSNPAPACLCISLAFTKGLAMNILVVDDEVMMLESIKIGLMSKGYNVVGFDNGQQALDHLSGRDHGIDLVITDYLMPIINGMDLLLAIRLRHQTLPVLIMTAYADTSLILEAFNNGCSGFVEKPFSREQLIYEIDRIEQRLLKRSLDK